MLRSLATLALMITGFHSVWAAPTPQSVPRSPGKQFIAEGLFEGGRAVEASIEDLRLAEHSSEGFERWVVDFADATEKKPGSVAPRFQIQYVAAEKSPLINGKVFQRKPAKFIFFFRQIAKNRLTLAKVRGLAANSLYVEKIHVYPPIEQGDMAMEFVLRDDVLFEAHQPVEKEGRLVLDLKARN